VSARPSPAATSRRGARARSERSPTAYQRKDAFYQRAKREGFRSRAAYKLQEIQRAHRLLRPGQRVVDLGCWPGGWLQVAAEAVGPRGKVVGADLAPIEPPLGLANVVAITGDLTDLRVIEAILGELGGPADVLLSDAAPKLTGIRATDRAREEALLEAIAALVPKLLRPGGDLLAKVLDGPEAEGFVRALRAGFGRLSSLRPEASRKGTSERYVIARGRRPEAPAA
jgi:23S rRNA (uridine2552-2'-O)-methyltransferase